MIIIEACPKCGHDLHDVVLISYPPIPKKECYNCGWTWEGQKEEVVRVPFVDKSNLIMRDATQEEIDSVNRYIDSISKPTGVNFFDLLDSK